MADKALAEKLLSEESGTDTYTGDYVEADVDVAMAHDITGPFTFRTSDEVTGDDDELFVPDRTVFTINYHAPADGVQAANNHNAARESTAKYDAHQLDVGDGICHAALAKEGSADPGDLVIGADSHSTTYGGIDTLGAGVDSTDLGTVLTTGELWLRVPKILRFEVNGDLGNGVYAKDLIPRFIGDMGFDGHTYMTAKYVGSIIKSLPIHERLVLSNMAIEMGGKTDLVIPSERTRSYLERQTGNGIDLGDAFILDDGADYGAVHSYDAAVLAPQVSKPSSPENAVDITEVAGTEVDQLFVGARTSGWYEDTKVVTDILGGETIAPNARPVAVPASKSVYQHISQAGIFQTFTDTSAVIQSAGCGPCVSYHQSVLGDSDVCLTMANRSLPGCEGPMESSVRLSGSATVGASALYGEITNPREVKTKRYDDTVFTEVLP